VRRRAALLVAACLLAPLTLEQPWTWRFGIQLAVIVTASGLWWRYRQRRPAAVLLLDSACIACGLEDGRVLAVRLVRYGVVTPQLVCAVLVTADNSSRQLFVPACSLGDHDHWLLRRSLLAWRERDDTQVDPRQSASRRGT
jgi:hypothetical protein